MPRKVPLLSRKSIGMLLCSSKGQKYFWDFVICSLNFNCILSIFLCSRKFCSFAQGLFFSTDLIKISIPPHYLNPSFVEWIARWYWHLASSIDCKAYFYCWVGTWVAALFHIVWTTFRLRCTASSAKLSRSCFGSIFGKWIFFLRRRFFFYSYFLMFFLSASMVQAIRYVYLSLMYVNDKNIVTKGYSHSFSWIPVKTLNCWNFSSLKNFSEFLPAGT
jgi:hypothetical protein